MLAPDRQSGGIMAGHGGSKKVIYAALAGNLAIALTKFAAAFFTGRTYQDLALEAGMPLGTMKSIVRRGLMRLRGCLEQ